MAKIKGKKEIKANITSKKSVINANIVKNEKTIKSTLTNVPTATTERKGIIRIATEQEVIDGISNDTAVTPYTLKNVGDFDKTFEYEQAIASDVWVIEHNLNKRPSIMVVDTADNVVEGAEEYINDNTVKITFNGSFKGKAYFN